MSQSGSIERVHAAGVVVGMTAGAILFVTSMALDTRIAATNQSVAARAAHGATVDERTMEVVVGQVTPTNDEFNDMLRNPAFWAAKREGKAFSHNGMQVWAPKAGLGGPFGCPLMDLLGREPRRVVSDTYRTVCVRLCDGAFFPVSFATTRDRFDDDADTCANTCTVGGSRLFVYRNPGEEPEAMEDLAGNPYRDLPTAFLFKTKYDPSCKCRPHPWEDAARDQHRIFALERLRSKGNREVTDELKMLRDKQKAAETEARVRRRADAVDTSAIRKAAKAAPQRSGAGRPVVTGSAVREAGTVTIVRGVTAVALTPGSRGGPVHIRIAPPAVGR